MIDFIDIGSSKGGSIKFAKHHFSNTDGDDGYGIDIDPDKVSIAQKNGYDVRCQSIFSIQDKAKWVTCLHTLEHLPDRKYCKKLILKACEIGESVYLSFPCFDNDGYLMDNDLRFFWSHWVGHTLHLTSLELHNILRSQSKPFKIWKWGKVTDSQDKAIVPLNAPIDVLGYDDTMDEKPFVEFSGVYREIRCIIGEVDYPIK